MDQLHGTSTTSTKMKELEELLWADQYTDAGLRKKILTEYQLRHNPPITPLTHPSNYNPLQPPEGWKYDPYYEVWVKI